MPFFGKARKERNMRRDKKLPELLAPAGDFNALVAAVLGGADAVYLGGTRFGARAFAKNFTNEELERAVRLCHIHGVRVYVTLNTLVFDKEMDDAVEYARTLHAIGVDALIAADLGVISRIREEIPALELHASTQMGAHNTEGVNFAASLGCKRVVLARECSSADIAKIVEKSDAECEVFLHGALCVCHSGQCLFSSMVGGRSGNRGECAQPCRLPYNNGKYPLSLSDLSLSEHVRELVEMGVASLKIEGRMKSADYVYEVTRIYRALLDEKRDSSAHEQRRLADVFSRGGFTDGYFTGKVKERMTGVRTEADKSASRAVSGGSFILPKIRVAARAKFLRAKECEMTLTASPESRWDNAGKAENESKRAKISVTVKGDIADEAENAPLTKEGLESRLSKMGNTPFVLDTGNIEITLDEGINLSPSSINALRREAAARLEKLFAAPMDALISGALPDSAPFTLEGKEIKARAPMPEKMKTNTAIFFKTDTLELLNEKRPDLLHGLDIVFVPLFSYSELSPSLLDRACGVYLPPVIMESEWNAVRAELKAAEKVGARYALLENISHLALISDTELIPVGDFRLNITNSRAASLYASLGVRKLILSPELTIPQARDIGGGVITLGRIPLMLTERCFIRESLGCDKCGRAHLIDRKGAKFPMLREYSHRNLIFNSAPTYMGDKKDELRNAKITHSHFIFSFESVSECAELLAAYKAGKPLVIPHRRVGKR